MWSMRARRRPLDSLRFYDGDFQREAGGSRESFSSSKAKNSRLPAAALGTAASVALKCNKVPLQVPHSAKCVKIPDAREKERDHPSADASRQRLHSPQANIGGTDAEKRLVGAN